MEKNDLLKPNKYLSIWGKNLGPQPPLNDSSHLKSILVILLCPNGDRLPNHGA